MEPALMRESMADDLVVVEPLEPNPPISVGVCEPGLNGLVDGVGREVCGRREAVGFRPFSTPAAENLEGRVPALVLRVDAVCCAACSMPVAALKSGKLSPLGDSGMVSRRGVELPLVGGPQS